MDRRGLASLRQLFWEKVEVGACLAQSLKWRYFGMPDMPRSTPYFRAMDAMPEDAAPEEIYKQLKEDLGRTGDS